MATLIYTFYLHTLGKSQLHFMDIFGETAMVDLAKGELYDSFVRKRTLLVKYQSQNEVIEVMLYVIRYILTLQIF